MKLFNIIYLYVIGMASMSGVIVHAQNANQLVVFDATFSVVSDNTKSVHGSDIARQFSQLLLIRDLQALSNLEISENRVNSNVNQIVLSTPLRELSSYQFQLSMVRNWISPTLIAENFMQEAISSGLVKNTPNPLAKQIQNDRQSR